LIVPIDSLLQGPIYTTKKVFYKIFISKATSTIAENIIVDTAEETKIMDKLRKEFDQTYQKFNATTDHHD
jgi:predicted ATPase